MSIIDEYDLDMYKNIVMSNYCKDEELICVFNSSSFLNTICFFLFFVMFLWGMEIISRYYTSYNITKYLKNRKAIYMRNMSRYIDDIKILCRSHVNDIIRIKKKIIPKNVEKINLNISINNNIQLFKNYLSSSASDLSNLFKYSISFTFSSKNSVYIQLFWGVVLNEVNDLIKEKTVLHKKSSNESNTVIYIDNFKKFLKEGFNKTIPTHKISDATTFLLDKGKNDIYLNSLDNSIYEFNSCFYKTTNSFYSGGNNITYTMPYDENFCVTDILNRLEKEKKNNNINNNMNEIKETNKNNKINLEDNKIMNSNNSSNSNINKKDKLKNIYNNKNYENVSCHNIRIPLIIILNDVQPANDDSLYMKKNNYEYTQSESNNNISINKNKNDTNNNDNNYSNTLIVLVDFKKIKDKYKPYIIKYICVLNEKQMYNVQKSKKKNELFKFVDILDIYGHEEHDKECLICMASYKDTLLMPCRHSSFCYDCMKSLRQEKCPICRRLFTSFIKFPLKNIDKGDGV
ncbi:E3 ubiquitin-protein ligase, putative [Hepatocystis sp. ex Piliocolobus tephrosceles]|nr:E3 ubiquitin-protein ligase, putative [Hepatocystis sp. ex Piliocolobus tephrosceles]